MVRGGNTINSSLGMLSCGSETVLLPRFVQHVVKHMRDWLFAWLIYKFASLYQTVVRFVLFSFFYLISVTVASYTYFICICSREDPGDGLACSLLMRVERAAGSHQGSHWSDLLALPARSTRVTGPECALSSRRLQLRHRLECHLSRYIWTGPGPAGASGLGHRRLNHFASVHALGLGLAHPGARHGTSSSPIDVIAWSFDWRVDRVFVRSIDWLRGMLRVCYVFHFGSILTSFY